MEVNFVHYFMNIVNRSLIESFKYEFVINLLCIIDIIHRVGNVFQFREQFWIFLNIPN